MNTSFSLALQTYTSHISNDLKIIFIPDERAFQKNTSVILTLFSVHFGKSSKWRKLVQIHTNVCGKQKNSTDDTKYDTKF